MPLERASIAQVVQIAPETTPGTAITTLANFKQLGSMSIEPSIEASVAQFRPQGQLFRAVTALGKDSSVASMSGVATYDEMPYLLSSLLKKATPTQTGLANGGTNSRQWLYTPNSNGGDEYQTYTIEHGSSARAGRFTYGVFTEGSLEFTRDGVSVSGSMIGQKYVDGHRLTANAQYTLTADATPASGGTFDLTVDGVTASAIPYDVTPETLQSTLEALSSVGTGNVLVTSTGATVSTASAVTTIHFIGARSQTAITVTYDGAALTGGDTKLVLASSVTGGRPARVALVPVLPDTVSVYLDSASGSLGTTKLDRAISASFAVQNRYSPIWTLDAAQSSWVAPVEVEPTVQMGLTVQANEEGMVFLERLRDGATSFLRIEAVGKVIEAAIRYRLRIDAAVQATAIGSLSDQDGVFGAEFTLTPVHDASWGKAFEITLCNTLTGL